MKTKNIILTEDQIIQQFQEWLTDCDAEELARVTGELFGGKCFTFFDPEQNTFNNLYEFEPDENYGGAFGEIE